MSHRFWQITREEKELNPHTFPLKVAIGTAIISICATGCSLFDSHIETEPTVPLGSPDSTSLLIVDCHVTYRGGSDRIDTALLRALDDALGGKPEATPVSAVLIDDHGDKHKGSGLGPGDCQGLILFPDLPPGGYRLWRIESSYYLSADEKKEIYGWDPDGPGEYPDELFFKHVLLPEHNDNVTFSIGSGEFLYFGKVAIDEKHSAGYGDKKLRASPPPHIEVPRRWEVDRHTCHFKKGQWELVEADENEITALENLLRVYRHNPWTVQWRQRLKELKEKTK